MAFKGYAGEKFNLTPGQLQKAFGPGGVAFDTTDRFDPGALGMPSPRNNRLVDGLNQIKQLGIDPNSFTAATFMSQYGGPTTAEELQNLIPLYEKMDKSRADLADRNAQRKFQQEMLGTAIGGLAQGARTFAQRGSDAFLAFNTQAPYRSEGVINQAIASVPQFQLPAFSLPPQSGTRYLS